jgi:hypothetical protein
MSQPVLHAIATGGPQSGEVTAHGGNVTPWSVTSRVDTVTHPAGDMMSL